MSVSGIDNPSEDRPRPVSCRHSGTTKCRRTGATPRPAASCDTYAMRNGERDRSLYVVTAGVLEVVLTTAEGPVSLLELRAGDIFGEMAFFDGLPRSANVRVLEAAEALVMTPDSFDRLRLAHRDWRCCS